MTKTDYQNQARQFLNNCPAEMTIIYAGESIPNWDNKTHRLYTVTIKTKRGQMVINFYDSLYNTEIQNMSIYDYLKKNYHLVDLPQTDPRYRKAAAELKKKKEEAKPTEYDILACLQKYDVGSMDDFLCEFGYEIHSTKDMTNFINTYNAVVKEWQDVQRCFTTEQIEQLSEIQ